MLSELIDALSGAAWKTWLGHTLRWLAYMALGLAAGWTAGMFTAGWLDPFLVAIGSMAGFLWGLRVFWIREFSGGGDFLRAWKATPRDWDGVADSVMDFWGPLVVATAALAAIGTWLL